MQKTFTPKDFFLWLIAMIGLYVSVVSFITLLFQYINLLFPDQLVDMYYDPYSAAIRFAIASLVIFFPVFFYTTRLLNNDQRTHPEKREYGVRKWLIYVTLFVAGISILIDLVMLINTFLNGDLTMRFVLKVVAVLITAGIVFAYYLSDMRGKWLNDTKTPKMIGWGIGAVVTLTILSGFFIIGSPKTARDLRFDDQRVNNLQTIQYEVTNYWQAKQQLPPTLDDLNDPISGVSIPKDPQTGTTYEYTITGDRSFELCVIFNQPSRAAMQTVPMKAIGGMSSESWDHKAGYTCFTRSIDPDLYPPFNKKTSSPEVSAQPAPTAISGRVMEVQ